MTGMLASVASVAEARLAAQAGADVIDFKDPSRGALGALPRPVIGDSVKAVGGRALMSATIGDIPAMAPALLVRAVQATAALGVDFVKIGFFPSPAADACARALSVCGRDVQLVAVLFADLTPDFALLDVLADSGFAGVMLDTANKDGTSLRDHMTDAAAATFVQRAASHDLLSGLAGSLRASDVPALLPLGPDYLGFRGALCRGANRLSGVDPDALAEIRALIPPHRFGARRPRLCP